MVLYEQADMCKKQGEPRFVLSFPALGCFLVWQLNLFQFKIVFSRNYCCFGRENGYIGRPLLGMSLRIIQEVPR